MKVETSPQERLLRLEALRRVRERHDPLLTYRPGPAQKACYESKATFRMLGGPSRGGKTIHAAVEVAQAALRRHPLRSSSVNGIYLVFAISREQITDVWYSKLRQQSRLKGDSFEDPLIPEHEVLREYFTTGAGRPTIKDIHLKNGHRILFAVSGDPNVWKRIQGKDFILGIVIDEQAGTQALIDECVSRMLDANGSAEMREKTGGSWFLWPTTETMINDAHHKLKELCSSGDPDFQYFQIDPADNPAITMEARERFKNVLSTEAYETRMMGTGSASGSVLIYGRQYSDQRHMRTTDWEPTKDANIWVGYDPGVEHPTGIVIACVEPDRPRKLRVLQCWKHARMVLDYDLDLIQDWLRGRAIEAFIYDPAARKSDKVTGKSVAGQIMERLIHRGMKVNRGNLERGYNRHEPGIAMVRQYLNPPPDVSGEAMLEINPSLEAGGQLLRAEFMMYRGREETGFTGAGGVIKKHDDLLDPLRYLVMQRPHWLKRPENPPLWPKNEGPDRPAADMRVKTDEEMRNAERRIKSERAARMRSQRIPKWRR